MIKPDMIPDEVVEAGARAAFIYYKCVPWDECGDKTLWRRLARAAIAAALNTWPGAEVVEWYHADKTLILPLPMEQPVSLNGLQKGKEPRDE